MNKLWNSWDRKNLSNDVLKLANENNTTNETIPYIDEQISGSIESEISKDLSKEKVKIKKRKK